MSLEALPTDAHLHGDGTVNRSLFCFPPNNSAAAATSSGVFAGDDPLKFYFPLLLCHVCIVFALSRAIHALLRRASVPLVISQILAGALLGPSFLVRVSPHAGELFTVPEGWVQINTVGGYAFMLQIFVIGVKTDLGVFVKSGKKAVAIAIIGAVAPQVAMSAAGAALSARVPASWKATFMLTGLTSSWSLSAFIVVCCTLDDLNLLSSKLGRLAMSAALIGDFANNLSVAFITSYLLASSPSEKLQRIGFVSIATFTIFVGFVVFVARPAILRLMCDVPEGALLCEARPVAVLLITITCGFASEVLGLHATYGPFMLGLLLPGGAPLGVTMAERLDRLVAGLLLPLMFAQGGMRLDVYKMTDASTCLLLEVFLVVGVVAKFASCMAPCLFCGMSHREAFIVGLMMNFKGITDVVYASAFMDVKHKKVDEELRVLACVHSQADVGPMLALLDASSPSPESPITLYLLHLAPFAGLTTSVLRPYKLGDRNSAPSGAGTNSEHIVNAFRFFMQQRPPGSASLLPFVCIAPYATVHDDVCAVALEKRAMLIVVPFHQRLAIDGSVENTTEKAGAIQAANFNVLHYSPCSVAILVDRGSLSVVPGEGADADGFPHRVALYFLGGPDDREALALAMYMAENAPIGLTVSRFVLPPEWRNGGDTVENRLDEEAVQEYVRRLVDGQRLVYSEHMVTGSDGMVAVIRETSRSSDLLIVGRRAESPESALTAGISDWSEHLELGVLGDLLTSADFGCRVSTLVVQQQTRAAAGEISRQSSVKNVEQRLESDGQVCKQRNFV
ncbi:cation/H(+) antiporter 15-like [Panicum miliaceum]|uniref:Cation/H(+) antiporter 15-like n=1 Tax=Panicum miliaceum TaxID=4540 RepID=A0A3L6PSW1_PANMI|nr:cation/H(+) antiporter 15-like [Panicum miliaceum]